MSTASPSPEPAVLFVCVRDGGTSQMAAALLEARTGACSTS